MDGKFALVDKRAGGRYKLCYHSKISERIRGGYDDALYKSS